MIFFLAAAVLILIFFIIRAVRSKGSLRARSAILTAGFSLAVTALVLPFSWRRRTVSSMPFSKA